VAVTYNVEFKTYFIQYKTEGTFFLNKNIQESFKFVLLKNFKKDTSFEFFFILTAK